MTMTMPTPNASTSEALNVGNVSGAQTAPAMAAIAARIAAGMLPTPTTSGGWQDLVKQFTQPDSSVSASTPSLNDLAKPTNGIVTPSTARQTAMPTSTGPTKLATGQQAFVQQMAPYAQFASEKTGLDPNLILAQWGNETGWGTSYQWQTNFNPAGIGITGPEVKGQGFGSVQGGVQAYIDFLLNNPRYQQVMQTKGAQQQAVALGNSGWAAGKYDSGGGPGSALIGDMNAIGNATGSAPAANVTMGPNPTGAVQIAQTQIGVPYQWGGESPGKNFDCSGLVQWTYAKAGVQLPRVAQAQYDATQKVPQGQQLMPGDLVFFGNNTSSISHVGIYVGNGQMIDAPHSGAQVRIESMAWPDYVGATRPGDPSGQTTRAGVSPTSPQVNTAAYQQAMFQMQAALNAGAAHG